MLRVISILITIVTSIISLNPAARGQQPSMADKLSAYLQGADSVMQFTGSAAIAKEGQIIYTGGFEFADVATSRKNAPTTRFSIGSVTKQFTATAVMQLQEKGLLSVYDKLEKYFPDYPENIASKVTIRHLLTHTSGIANYTATPTFGTMLEQDPPLEKQIELLSTLPLEFEPGTQYKYSNTGYKLLEAIVGKVSGIPWATYVADSVLTKAGMNGSGYDLATVDESLRATGYSTVDKVRQVAEQWPAGVAGGTGGLYSTVLDLVKWDSALREGKVLNQTSMNAMFEPYLQGYGYGWVIDSLNGYQRIWHDGLIAGFTGIIVRVPSEKLCVVVLANDDQTQVHKISQVLTTIALGLPYDNPVLKQPIKVDPASYGDFVGAYELEGGSYRFITVDKARIFAQRAGGTQFEIFPEAPDKFYYSNDNATTLTFKRDSAGKVTSHIIHQLGTESEHRKLSDTEAAKVLPKYEVAKVDPKIYDDYIGEYELMPGFSIVVRRKGDQLFTQATRQDEFEVFPSSETKFFLKVVDAQIEFIRGADGKVEKLVLYQNGSQVPAPKVK